MQPQGAWRLFVEKPDDYGEYDREQDRKQDRRGNGDETGKIVPLNTDIPREAAQGDIQAG
jgi:hypothetical protein